MNPPSAGVRAVLWPGSTKGNISHGPGIQATSKGCIQDKHPQRRAGGGVCITTYAHQLSCIGVSNYCHVSRPSMKQINKNTCQSSTALGIWLMPCIQAELGRNAEMRWCSRGLSALGCWAGGPTRGWRPRQANGEKHGDQGTATLGKSMHPPSAGVRAVLWPGRIYKSLSNLQVVASSVQSGTKPKPGSQNTATKLGNHLCMATKIGRQS